MKIKKKEKVIRKWTSRTEMENRLAKYESIYIYTYIDTWSDKVMYLLGADISKDNIRIYNIHTWRPHLRKHSFSLKT